MGLHVLPILKALAPLVANAGGLVATMRSADSAGKTEDRLRQLEAETLRAGEVLTGVTQQLQAVAEELRAQAEVNAASEKRARTTLLLALAGLGAGVAALAVALLT